MGKYEIFVPDTTQALGDDIYQTKKMECREPNPDLIVRASPMEFIDDTPLLLEFAKEMPYSEAKSKGMYIFPGIVEGNKVRK